MPLSSFRKRYLENCDRLHIAEAIAALYYPEMTEKIKEVYGQSNIFWGSQEGVLRTDIKEMNLFCSLIYKRSLERLTKSVNELAVFSMKLL